MKKYFLKAIAISMKMSFDASEELVTEVVKISKKAGDNSVEQNIQNIMVLVRWAIAIGLSMKEYASFVTEGKDPTMLSDAVYLMEE